MASMTVGKLFPQLNRSYDYYFVSSLKESKNRSNPVLHILGAQER